MKHPRSELKVHYELVTSWYKIEHMFHFNREPKGSTPEHNSLEEQIRVAKENLDKSVQAALNRITAQPEDDVTYTDSDRLTKLSNSVEVIKTEAYVAGGAAWLAALTAVIYGLTKYPESKELAQQITSLGVVGGGLGHYAVLIWYLMQQNGLVSKVAEIAKRYE